jgi:small subunit ribosomal protein S21
VVSFGGRYGVTNEVNEHTVCVDMSAMRQVQCQPYMANVRLGSGESFESMLRRFGKQVEGDRILAEVRRRRFYEKPSVTRKKKEAVKRRKSSRSPSSR